MTKREELKKAIKMLLSQLVRDARQYLNVDDKINLCTNEIIKEVEIKFYN